MKTIASILALLIAVITPAGALADEEAEQFVAENGAAAIAILNNPDLPLTEKKAQFRAIVDTVVDVPRVTKFVLGNFAKAERNRHYDTQEALDADMAVFGATFREYAIGVYEARLGDYGGEMFEVTGSTERRTDDYIVHTRVSGGAQDKPLEVNWRVIRRDGDLRVVDVEVYDVWLAVNQRDEIVGFVQQGRGDINVATRALQATIDERNADQS